MGVLCRLVRRDEAATGTGKAEEVAAMHSEDVLHMPCLSPRAMVTEVTLKLKAHDLLQGKNR
jgi:hypothetical protein